MLQVNFKDYAGNLKTFLDEGFAGKLEKILGETQPLSASLMGGKRIRGALLCLVTETLGGDLQDALSRAVAIEFIQTATLIHDDFIDQHQRRRNVPALWTLEGARRAVLLGDIIFSSAIQMMSELGRSDGLIVSRAIAEVAKGVYQEPNADGTVYEKIIHLKTAILFGAACQLGAVAAGADERLQQKWRAYGLKIGEAYQMADDLHEVERYLLTGSISEIEMIAIAPAIIFFNRDRDFSGREIRQGFQTAVVKMEREIENRLHQAISAIEDCDLNGQGRLARKTPWDIIRMFNEAETRVSSR